MDAPESARHGFIQGVMIVHSQPLIAATTVGMVELIRCTSVH
jgi:hypothetical protein